MHIISSVIPYLCEGKNRGGSSERLRGTMIAVESADKRGDAVANGLHASAERARLVSGEAEALPEEGA